MRSDLILLTISLRFVRGFVVGCSIPFYGESLYIWFVYFGIFRLYMCVRVVFHACSHGCVFNRFIYFHWKWHNVKRMYKCFILPLAFMCLLVSSFASILLWQLLKLSISYMKMWHADGTDMGNCTWFLWFALFSQNVLGKYLRGHWIIRCSNVWRKVPQRLKNCGSIILSNGP